MKVKVHSPDVSYTDEYIEAQFDYHSTDVTREGDTLQVFPRTTRMTMRTSLPAPPRLGVMLVGWGGNNGSTVTAAVEANRLGVQWQTKEGRMSPNYFGSITQASTVSLGADLETGEEVFAPMADVLPMASPNDFVIDGWDISAANIAKAMERAKVLDYDLQRQLKPVLSKYRPRPSIYDKDFIAANQEERADNVIKGSKQQQLEQIRSDIRDFRARSGVDSVIVLWTANTERFSDVRDGLNATADQLLLAIQNDEFEVAPSTIFAVASILEGCPYLNGSPQNTFVPGCVDLAERHGVFIGGDDFKSGQTKFKSVLVDFLVNAGIKPRSIVSYNHLGNNDGKNLSAPQQFRSKEISKSSVVDDMVAANPVLYNPGESPDHCVVIKYVPHVGDSKRAMDEYVSELMLGGSSTIAVHNVCEDSLLASPIIIDLVVLTELCQRITFKVEGNSAFQSFHPVLSILSYLCKAPLVPPGAAVVNALSRQRACIENVLRACVGLAPLSHMALEQKLSKPQHWQAATGAPAPVLRAKKTGAAAIPTKKVVQNGIANGVNGHAENGV